MPMYDSVDALKKEVRASVEGTARHEYDMQGSVRASRGRRWQSAFVGKIPDEAYEETARSIDQTLRAQLAQQGQDYDEFVKQQGGEQAFNIGLMMQARQTHGAADYALDAVFYHMGLALRRPTTSRTPARSSTRKTRGRLSARTWSSPAADLRSRDVARRYAASKYVVEHAKMHLRRPERRRIRHSVRL